MPIMIKDEINTALQVAFAPQTLRVENESFRHNVPEGSETHFKVTLVSEAFSGQRSVKRHQSVYAVLKEWLAGPVHALALHTYTPDEWDQVATIPASPDCRGGTGK